MPYTGDGMSRGVERVLGVDERLVMPGSGIEIVQGRVVSVPGADPPHATRHLTLGYLLGAHTAPGFVAALDLLTRAGERSDFAPDASVYPEGNGPRGSGRRLEVMAFEIVSQQRLGVSTGKARALSERGVERIIALVLGKGRALDWDRGASSPTSGRWRPMHVEETIEHACLSRPLPVRALLDVARADEAVLAALEARRPDLVGPIEARGEARGEARALRESVLVIADLLGLRMTPARRHRLAAADVSGLRALVAALRRDRRWPPRSLTRRRQSARTPVGPH